MARARHARIFIGLGVLFLSAATLGQVQTLGIWIHIGMDPQALLNLNVQTLEKSEQETVSYRPLLFGDQNSFNPSFEATLLERQKKAVIVPVDLGYATLEPPGLDLSTLVTNRNGFSANPVIALGADTDSEYEKVTVFPWKISQEAVLGEDQVVSANTTDQKAPKVCLEVSSRYVFAGEWVTVKATVQPARQNDIEVSVGFRKLDGFVDPVIYDDPITKTKRVTIPAGKTESAPFSFQTRWDSNYNLEEYIWAYLWGSTTVGSSHPFCLCPYLTIQKGAVVTLSASPNPVDEGQPVTITATITGQRPPFRALTVSLNYPNAKTTDTAVDPDDYSKLTSIIIPADATTGTGEIQTRQDADQNDEMFTVAIDESSLALGVIAENPKEVSVTINDHNRPGIVVLPTEVLVPEGDSKSVKVKLMTRPLGAVSVTLADDGDSDLTWSGTNGLTFTPSNWDKAQTVTLMAGEDNDFAHDMETLTLMAGDGGYDNVTATIAVTIEDNDGTKASFYWAKSALYSEKRLDNGGSSVYVGEFS